MGWANWMGKGMGNGNGMRLYRYAINARIREFMESNFIRSVCAKGIGRCTCIHAWYTQQLYSYSIVPNSRNVDGFLDSDVGEWPKTVKCISIFFILCLCSLAVCLFLDGFWDATENSLVRRLVINYVCRCTFCGFVWMHIYYTARAKKKQFKALWMRLSTLYESTLIICHCNFVFNCWKIFGCRLRSIMVWP